MLRIVSVLGSAAALCLASGLTAGVTPSLAAGPPSFVQVCGAPGAAHAGCMAIRVDHGTQPAATSAPTGYGPSQLQSAYKLASASGTLGAGKTVAIVDAYDDPTALTDVCHYRSNYGLPALAQCSGAPAGSPTFTKLNQTGGSTPPASNSNWSQEISLDLDMVSAICPNCNILLVEANSSNLSDLGTSVNTAAAQNGVVAISNSYGGSESSSETTSDSYYNHPGIAVTVSSGDSGYGVQYPAASKYVIAVGGTTLKTASNARGWTESAWTCSGFFGCYFSGGAGSGCSAYETKPTWQKDTGCARRTVADVSADADPSTGVSVYYNGGWSTYGGTSVASPIIASVFALGGNYSATANPNPAALLYNNTGSLFDVTTSDAKVSCSPSYLCNAGAGYDGPTGLGTPNGTSAF